MPLTESKPDALSQSYALAVFEMARDSGGASETETILGELEDILELARADRSFNEFLASRVIGATARRKSLETLFKGKVSPLTLHTLLLLNAKGRLAVLPGIVASLDALVQRDFGRVEVDIFTASPIAQGELDRIRDQLAKALGKDVVPHPYTDPSMIGGVKLRMGDTLIDASLATRLRRAKEQLRDRGTSTVRARVRQMFDENASPE